MTKESSTERSSQSIATLIVMVSTMITRILGYLKFALIAHYFGGAGVADVINAVFSIPNNLRKLMAEGALTTAFIPALSKHVVQDDKEGAVRITRQILAFQYVVIIPFVLLSIVNAPNMINIFTSFSDGEKIELATNLYRWFIPYLLLISVAAMVMAVLNTHAKFLLGALSPLFFSVAVIGCIWLLTPTLGVYSMAFGVLLGGLGQVLIQYPLFRKLGYRLSPDFNFKSTEFRIVLKRYLPALVTSSVFAINQQIAVNLATRLADGSSSALAYAIVFFQLPFGIFSAAVNTVFYPQLAKAAGANQFEKLGLILKRGLHLLFIFLAPSALFMSILANEIISVALMRGKFTQANVLMTAATLVGFSVGMFFTAAYNFSQRYFYAKGSFKLPLISAIIACTLDVVLSLLLMQSMGVAGLAYANSIAFFLGFLMLFGIILKEQPLHQFKDSILLIAKVLVSMAVGYGVYLLMVWRVGNSWWQEGNLFWRNLALLFLQGGVPALCVLVMYLLLKVEFASDLMSKLGRKATKES